MAAADSQALGRPGPVAAAGAEGPLDCAPFDLGQKSGQRQELGRFASLLDCWLGRPIVVESARRAGTELSFFEYLKVGVPLTLLTTLVEVAWLSLVAY